MVPITLIATGQGQRFPFYVRTVVLCAVLSFFVAAGAWAAPGEPTDANVADLIDQASTAEDYTSLAAYFRAKADAAARDAEHHGRMLAASTRRGRSTMRVHCKQLIEASQQLEREYRALAEEAEKLAADAEP